jgi:HSP20 family protein
MNTLTHFVPFRSPLEGVAVLQNRLNSIFNDFANSNGELRNETLSTGNFIPPVDIYEDAHQLVLRLEVPGIPQEDLQINLENQTLTVKGERNFVQDEKEENFHRIERRYGSLSAASLCPVRSRRSRPRQITKTASFLLPSRRRKPLSRSR